MKTRYTGEVVELTTDCELGAWKERAVVLATDGKSMTLVFPDRPTGYRHVCTGADYLYLKGV